MFVCFHVYSHMTACFRACLFPPLHHSRKELIVITIEESTDHFPMVCKQSLHNLSAVDLMSGFHTERGGGGGLPPPPPRILKLILSSLFVAHF